MANRKEIYSAIRNAGASSKLAATRSLTKLEQFKEMKGKLTEGGITDKVASKLAEDFTLKGGKGFGSDWTQKERQEFIRGVSNYEKSANGRVEAFITDDGKKTLTKLSKTGNMEKVYKFIQERNFDNNNRKKFLREVKTGKRDLPKWMEKEIIKNSKLLGGSGSSDSDAGFLMLEKQMQGMTQAEAKEWVQAKQVTGDPDRLWDTD